MSSENLHERADVLGAEVINRHRAITSIMEELEAVDWYDQRVKATADESLAEVLGHNRDEEKEHAAMTLEWLRRNDPVMDRHLRTYLFTEGSLLDIEHAAEHSGSAAGVTAASTGPSSNDSKDHAMNHLHRHLAPVSSAAWAEIDEELASSLASFQAGRKVVDVVGPKGWSHSAETTGRATVIESPAEVQVQARIRRAQPLVEFRIPFRLRREELDAIGRGADDADLDPVRIAAKQLAVAEDHAIFHGYAPGMIEGVVAASDHDPVLLSGDYDQYPRFVGEATAKLRLAGVTGPFALAMGPKCYSGVVEQSEMGGYPVFDHLKMILEGGPVVFAPGVDGAVLLSTRGGDVELVIGQDTSIGYLSHDAESVELYLEESFTVRVAAAEAAVYLTHGE